MIWGDFNANKAQLISFKFKMCKDKPTCESEENIRKWLSGKFIVLLHNQVKFNQEGYYEEALTYESRLKYIPLSS